MKLIIALLLVAGVAQAAPINLQMVDRVKSNVASIVMPQFIHEKDGSKTLVQVEDRGDQYNLLLVAYGKSGAVLAQTEVRRAEAGENLFLNEASRNASNELMAVLFYSRDTATEGHVESINISKGTGIRVASGEFPDVVGRIMTGGKHLVLAKTDLDHGPHGSYPELLRVLDEDTGDVVSQTILDNGVAVYVGLNNKGKPTALVYGYELFGVIDMLTGKYKELAPPRQQPSNFPGLISTPIGDLLEFSDSNTTRLLDIK
jgi:hypothetical protein